MKFDRQKSKLSTDWSAVTKYLEASGFSRSELNQHHQRRSSLVAAYDIELAKVEFSITRAADIEVMSGLLSTTEPASRQAVFEKIVADAVETGLINHEKAKELVSEPYDDTRHDQMLALVPWAASMRAELAAHLRELKNHREQMTGIHDPAPMHNLSIA